MPWGAYPAQGPPPRKTHTGLIIGLVAGVVILLLIGAGAVAVIVNSADGDVAGGTGGVTSAAPASTPEPATPTPSPGPVTFQVPGSVSGYTRVQGSVARRMTGQIREEMKKVGSAGQGLDKAAIALYMKGTSPLVFMGFSGSQVPQMGAELERSPSNSIDQVFLGAGFGDTDDYPAGAADAVLRCGKAKTGGTSTAMCAWADRSALILLQGSDLSLKELSSITRSFRTAALRRG